MVIIFKYSRSSLKLKNIVRDHSPCLIWDSYAKQNYNISFPPWKSPVISNTNWLATIWSKNPAVYSYRQTSNIRHALIGNEIVNHSKGRSIAWRHCSDYIFILNLISGFNGFSKDNCKTRRETLKLGDLVWLILEVWWYSAAGGFMVSNAVQSQMPKYNMTSRIRRSKLDQMIKITH